MHRTPKAIFDGFATAIPGADPMISREKFATIVAMYGGRSPAASGGEMLSSTLFEQLAVRRPDGGMLAVPYDLFCSELCPARAPDALLRVTGVK